MYRYTLPIISGWLALSSLASCSYLWTFQVDVTVADDVALTEGAAVRLVYGGEGLTLDEISHDGTFLMLETDRRDYEMEGSVCCAPVEVLMLYAYVDLDDNQTWDDGEPWGADPNNPVTIDDNDYVGSILLENDT